MKRILLVEDDPQVEEMVTFAFEKAGYEVHGVDRMDAALSLFKARQIDLILTDFHIQQGSGRRLLYEIRKFNSKVPVFLMTATPFIDESSLSIYSFSKVFLKPFLMEDIVSEANRILKNAA